MRAAALGPSVEPLYGATKRVRGVPKSVCGTHAGTPIGAFGGSPYGATKREGCAEMGVAGACGRGHWGL
eukprot:3234054-Pyramimonas_sp.AAC.1